MTFQSPPDDEDVVYEAFHPFGHVPGRYEWCRIISPTHGTFDIFIVLGETTAEPATVYVHNDQGEAYMAERYPECDTIRVPVADLVVSGTDGGRVIEGRLVADEGPVRAARMTLRADEDAKVRAEPYGGDGKPVWGSERFTCWGVDHVLDATATGELTFADGEEEVLGEVPALVTLSSFGRIAPLTAPTPKTT